MPNMKPANLKAQTAKNMGVLPLTGKSTLES